MSRLANRIARLEARSGRDAPNHLTMLIKVIDPDREPEAEFAEILLFNQGQSMKLKRTDNESEESFLQRVNEVEATQCSGTG